MHLLKQLLGWLTLSRRRIYFLFLIPATLPLFLFGYSVYSEVQAQNRERVEKSNTQIAVLTARLLEEKMKDSIAFMEVMAARPLMVSAFRRGDFNVVEDHLKTGYTLSRKSFLFVSVYDLDGTMRAIYPANEEVLNKNFAFRDWHKGVSKQWKPYVSEVYKTAVKPYQSVVAIAVPLKDERGQTIGILMAPYDVATVAEWLTEIVPAIDDRQIEIVDKRGQLLARPYISPLQPIAELNGFIPVRRALSGEHGSGRFSRDGVDSIVSYGPISSLTGGVIVSLRTDIIASMLHGLRQRLFFWGTIFILLAAFFAMTTASLYAQVRDSQRLTQLVIDNAHDAFVSMDESGLIIDWNPQAEKTFGWKRNEVIGRNLAETIIPTAFREQHQRGLDHFLATAEGAVLNKRIELTALQRDESEFPVEITISPALVGKSYIFNSFIQDVSERKRAEHELQRAAEALRKSEEKYRSLIANIPDISWTATAQGQVTFISSNVLNICGFSSEEVCAGGVDFWVQRLHPEDRKVLQERFQSLFTHQQKYDYEYRFMRKDGQWIWLHARADVAYERDGVQVTDGIISEITKRKAAEDQNVTLRQALEDTNRELERASRLKSQFLASMSHELRTPLNAIVGFSDLLSDETAGALNEKQKRFVNHVRTGSGHLLRLINDILDISKIEAGQMDLHLETIDLQTLLPEVLSLVKPLAMQGNVRLETETVTACVSADRVRLKQVLYNLLSNAIKFTPQGGEVRIDCKQKQSFTAISVTDTGQGIRPEDQDVIFEEFRQVGESSKGIKEGTGLGLAITSRIVKLHGGEIWVESEPDKGSRFIFTVPTATEKCDESVEEGIASPALRYRDGAAAPLILVIDDEPSASELISSFLVPEGYRVMVAHSAAEGQQLARKHKPDLITLDILMPDGNGFSTLFELRSDPNTSEIPIMVVSIVDQKKMGISFGAKEYLVKPIEKSALLQAVQRQLGASRQRQSVLVIDDDVLTSAVICEELSKHGYLCHGTTSGKAAFQHLESNQVDLILLDLLMPEMNGFEVLKGLKANEKLSSIPVIVITAKNLNPEEIEILKRETSGYVEKTGSWTERLKADVRRFLEKENTTK